MKNKKPGTIEYERKPENKIDKCQSPRDLTFLTEEQIFGDKAKGINQLDIFAKVGTKAAITDFSILSGGYVSDNYHIDSDKSLKGRTGYSWSSTRDGGTHARCVDSGGTSGWHDRDDRNVSARSASLSSGGSPSIIPPNAVRGQDGVLRFKEGEYPQTAAGADVSAQLDAALKNGTLKTTGKAYTTDSHRWNEIYESFTPLTHTEYEYAGKKYIQVKANLYNENVSLSNGGHVKTGEAIWVEVEPITWLYDEKTGIMVTEKLIFAGVQFNEQPYDGDFSKTTIKNFMDTYVAKEIRTDYGQDAEGPHKQMLFAEKPYEDEYPNPLQVMKYFLWCENFKYDPNSVNAITHYITKYQAKEL